MTLNLSYTIKTCMEINLREPSSFDFWYVRVDCIDLCISKDGCTTCFNKIIFYSFTVNQASTNLVHI